MEVHAAAHLVGHVQNVTAEDLEKHAGEVYTAGSVIGRSGAEGLFEKELKGRNGCRIYIVDSDGNEKEELANRIVENGQDIKLTIDSKLQKTLYEQFQGDKSCSVAMDPGEDYGNPGLSWQKDASWGSYYVTTLHAYEPVVLENALIYSDNIYFAKAALKIGSEKLKEFLLHLGFQEELPFEIVMAKSQFSNTENIGTEIQLADSGYGQGQILINPLHMACIYTAFCNEGNVIKPHLLYSQEAKTEYWIPNAFSAAHADLVLGGLKKVVNDPHGTGYVAHREDILLAGKTGTAEIKASKEDTSGTELGWFAVFTAEHEVETPILLISMAEDVKGRGGSGYVVGKDKTVLENWFEEKE